MTFSINTMTNKGLVPISQHTTWKKFSSFDLHLINTDKFGSSNVIPEIKELTNKLSAFPSVKRVRAIAKNFPDLHELNFDIELEKDTELSYENWEKLEDIVIEYEWKLRDKSGEKWYFHTQILEELPLLKDSTPVICTSDHKQGAKIDRPSSLMSIYQIS